LRQREAVAAWCQQAGLEAHPQRVVVAHGAQHALALTLMSLARPGGVVLTEDLTYQGAKALATMLHMSVRGVSTDDQGLVPEAVEAACARGDVVALYTVPTVHNPTATILPTDRREAIIAIARRHGIAIIEDDVFGFLAEAETRPPSFAQLAPEISYHVSGLSKSVLPGLRMGFAVAPDAAGAERLTAALWTTTTNGPGITAALATHWMETGTAHALAAWQRQEAMARQQIARTHLGHLDYACQPSSFHIWLRLPEPWTPAALVAVAARRRVFLTSPEAFTTGDHRAGRGHARVCLQAARSRADVEKGTRILAEMLAGDPDGQFAVV